LETLWKHLGNTLETPWKHFGNTLETLWKHFLLLCTRRYIGNTLETLRILERREEVVCLMHLGMPGQVLNTCPTYVQGEVRCLALLADRVAYGITPTTQ